MRFRTIIIFFVGNDNHFQLECQDVIRMNVRNPLRITNRKRMYTFIGYEPLLLPLPLVYRYLIIYRIE